MLTVPPPRDPISPFIPRTSSLAFHPREMVYAVGSLDGSGKLLRANSECIHAKILSLPIVRVMGCKLPS